MQETKSNFIEEMRKKLNNYHIERLHHIELGQRDKDHFKEEVKAREALMQFDQTDHDDDQPSGFEDITGWNSTRPIILSQNQNFSERRSLGARKNVISSVTGKTLGFQFQKRQRNPDMINYLKVLLTRLQSPVSTKRCLKTQNIKRVQQATKMRVMEATQTNKKNSGNFFPKQPNEKQANEKQPTESKETKAEKAKFQTIDLNTENNPFSTQSSRAASHYQKIKRKSNQYDIDIAREKDILQQLIKGNSTRNAFSCQKGHKSSQKFTLKNLLC